MSDRRRLARDPLADLLDTPTDPPAPSHTGAASDRDRRAASPRRAARITVQMDPELADQVRDAVMWLHKVDVHTTMSAIAEVGLRAELRRLAAAHNDGKPFPRRTGQVPTGRPPSFIVKSQ